VAYSLSAPSKEIILQRQLPDLCLHRLRIHRHSLLTPRAVRYLLCTLKQLLLPTRGRVRAYIELLGQFRKRLLAESLKTFLKPILTFYCSKRAR